MLRRFCVALFVVCFTLCMSPLAFAAEAGPPFGDRELVKIREGVYEYVAPDGSIQKTYIGIAGIEDRIDGLKRQLDVTGTDQPWGIDQTKKITAISQEIATLEMILEWSLEGEGKGNSNSKIASDCDDSTKYVYANIRSPGAGWTVYGDVVFSAYGSCLAYGAAYAYYWDEGTGTQTDSQNSGGYVSSINIEAAVSGGHNGAYCEYSSAVLYLNLGGYQYDPFEYPEDCYCPECS